MRIYKPYSSFDYYYVRTPSGQWFTYYFENDVLDPVPEPYHKKRIMFPSKQLKERIATQLDIYLLECL